MKIGLVSARFSNFPWGSGNYIYKALRRLGYEVVYDADFRRDYPIALPKSNEIDLLLVWKGSGIEAKYLKTRSYPKILWYPDTWFMDHTKRDAIVSFRGYDIVYTIMRSEVEIYRENGYKNVKYKPPGVDVEIFKPYPEIEQKYDIGFCGSMYKERWEKIVELSRKYNLVMAFGYYNEKLAKFYAEVKLVFNLGIHGSGMQLRVLEAMACGRVLLSNIVDDENFVLGKDYITFDDNQIREILNNDEKRIEIERRAREKALRNTWEIRLEEIIEEAKHIL